MHMQVSPVDEKNVCFGWAWYVVAPTSSYNDETIESFYKEVELAIIKVKLGTR